jgi:hypothetical protein
VGHEAGIVAKRNTFKTSAGNLKGREITQEKLRILDLGIRPK